MVWIIGPGGPVGTRAVQLAKSFGAEVTAVDSTGKAAMLGSIGADHVIDYTKEDFTKNGETYNIIFDVIGKSSLSRCIKSLKENGIFLLGNPRLSQLVRRGWTVVRVGRKVIGGAFSYKAEGVAFLKELIVAGKNRSGIA